eukprot:CAMPEP_0119355428 /NCGR_PEP_ID=MMETSP1334-20130426/4263_1 /TAXON_ID=127549 /ORGANISM="Calcidiscus leptoporus, Strain RCC1130" /LENGTH=336 /DNA_ID=CAMNT_0007369253 /DNA_START=16 /DNA_END=1026 /DNA_ORIENTATION=-
MRMNSHILLLCWLICSRQFGEAASDLAFFLKDIGLEQHATTLERLGYGNVDDHAHWDDEEFKDFKAALVQEGVPPGHVGRLRRAIQSRRVEGACQQEVSAALPFSRPEAAAISRFLGKVGGSLEGEASGTDALLKAESLAFPGRGIDDEDAFVIAFVIVSNPVLKALKLGRNRISNMGAAAIFEGLKANVVLSTLDLTANKIGDEGAKAIGKALTTNVALKQLHLQNNQIGEAGAKAIGKGLNSNAALKYLSLGRNSISDVGAMAIGEALKNNTVLKELFLYRNNIGDEGAESIGKALKVNRVLTTLSLQLNRIGDVGATAFGEALKKNALLTRLE